MPVEIRTKSPDGPHNADHDVWLLGEHVFTIHPHLDVCDERRWQLKEEFKGVDMEFVSNIGIQI
jgi:hypothetical protein